MKFQTIIAIMCLLAHVNIAQTNNYTITCPENTFLGAFACTDIDDIPSPINTIEAAMVSPYNIQIEGELPPSTQVIMQDNGVIFFCEGDARVVTREIIFCAGYFGCGGFEPYEILARCSFTIETIADVTPIDFIAPADELVPCNTLESYPGEVTFIGDDCFAFNQDQAYFTDETVVEGNNNIIIRTWRTTDVCGNISEPQIQTISTNCTPICTKPNTGTFICDN